MKASPRKLLTIGLWVVAVIGTMGLAYQRYHAAVAGSVGADFTIFFQAGHQIAAGHSPYVVKGYVYPPPVALALAPFSHMSIAHVWKAWTAAELWALLAGVALFVASKSGTLAGWRLPALFGFCGITVLHFWPLTVGLYLGQADAFGFAALLFSTFAASRAWPATRGAFIGVAGLLKTWPAAAVLTLLQKDLDRRCRSVLSFVLAILVAPLLAFGFGGLSGGEDLFKAIFRARNQALVSDSVWEIPHLLFAHSGLARPVVVSPAIQVLVTAVLLVWVIALLAVAVRTGGSEVICTWNVTFCIILLLPVSHRAYSLFALPVLWVWVAEVLRPGRVDRRTALVTVVLLLWWLMLTKSWPDSGSPASISAIHFSVVFVANLVACTVSTVAARLIGVDQTGADGDPNSHTVSVMRDL